MAETRDETNETLAEAMYRWYAPAGVEPVVRHGYACAECGLGVAVDEDGCCRMCGSDTEERRVVPPERRSTDADAGEVIAGLVSRLGDVADFFVLLQDSAAEVATVQAAAAVIDADARGRTVICGSIKQGWICTRATHHAGLHAGRDGERYQTWAQV